MRVTVSFRPRRQEPRTLEFPAGATIRDVLAATRQPSDHTLVIRGADPIPEDEPLRDGDDLVLLSAFSGG